jgi:uncharacterized phage protein (TIGR01671 family)
MIDLSRRAFKDIALLKTGKIVVQIINLGIEESPKEVYMREIKFRGKRDDNGEWVYGSLNIYKYDSGEVDYNIMALIDNSFIMVNVIPESIGQFTGLKDKNGKEIWENDIVQDEFNTGVVFWNDYRGMFNIDDSYTDNPLPEEEDKKRQMIYPFDDWINYEVIGNIYDNQELLK